jgi:5-methylcytosine-specific restriction enzyme A
MSFSLNTIKIANEFSSARTEPFKEHPIANLIRNDWPESLVTAFNPPISSAYKVDSSPGKGRWSEAPWLAILHPQVTTSAMAGFYPVYLFEPGFETVCLVMGQGAQSLSESIGKKTALVELVRRAELLRKHGENWQDKGFDIGPFATMRAAAVGNAADAQNDSWSGSVAFGKRYLINQLPTHNELTADLGSMLQLYNSMATKEELKFSKIDIGLANLKLNGELPKSRDGAIKTLEHTQLEKKIRIRNKKLINQVKKALGYVCQACSFSFAEKYGDQMEGFIEAHHKVPLSKLGVDGAELEPSATDFMVLCSNCHKAIHRAGCPDLETFRKQIRK